MQSSSSRSSDGNTSLLVEGGSLLDEGGSLLDEGVSTS